MRMREVVKNTVHIFLLPLPLLAQVSCTHLTTIGLLTELDNTEPTQKTQTRSSWFFCQPPLPLASSAVLAFRWELPASWVVWSPVCLFPAESAPARKHFPWCFHLSSRTTSVYTRMSTSGLGDGGFTRWHANERYVLASVWLPFCVDVSGRPCRGEVTSCALVK